MIAPLSNFYLIVSCGQLDEKVGIVGLDLGFVSRFVSYNGSALLAAVNDYITALRVGECLHGAENAAAGICAVSRVYINVERAKAERTMIS